MLFCKIKKNYF